MIEENFNGSSSFNRRNDGRPHRKHAASVSGASEDLSAYFEAAATGAQLEELIQLEIHNSNSRLDAYLFYYSSKL